MPTQLELAYLAGLIDGEGCFVIKKNNHQHFTQSVAIGMTDVRVLTWVQNIFGGNVYQRLPGTARSEVSFVWTLNKREDVSALVNELMPYLKVKRLAATIVQEFCVNFPKNKTYTAEKFNKMAEYVEYMRIANGRGPGTTALKERFLCALTQEEALNSVQRLVLKADELLFEIN